MVIENKEIKEYKVFESGKFQIKCLEHTLQRFEDKLCKIKDIDKKRNMIDSWIFGKMKLTNKEAEFSIEDVRTAREDFKQYLFKGYFYTGGEE